ncbi:hypothetical protein YC2023_065761 [Brassica napus]
MIARSLVKHATLRYQLVGFLIFKFGGSPNFLSTTPTLSQPSNKTKVDLTPASGACERFRHRRHRFACGEARFRLGSTGVGGSARRLQRVEEETTLSAQIWLVGSQIYNDLDLPWSGIDCWWVFRLVFSVNRLL